MNELRRRLTRLARHAGRPGGTFAFLTKDLRTSEQVGIRLEEAFPAASTIKVPIMLAMLERVRRGEVALSDTMALTAWHKTGGSGVFQHFHEGLKVTLEDACTAMIVLSDNTATNMVLDATGIERVNQLLDQAGCHRTRLHRYLGKPDMPGPAGPSQAVPAELGRLMELVWRHELLTPQLCRRALLFMRRQQHRALAPRLLPEGTALAHKTGSLDGVRHDFGLFWLAEREPPKPHRTRDVMALPADELPSGEPVVFVAMSKGMPDLRWTVENRAEVTIARAVRAAFDAYSASPPASSSSSSPPVTASRMEK